jgi:hypothetical protein
MFFRVAYEWGLFWLICLSGKRNYYRIRRINASANSCLCIPTRWLDQLCERPARFTVCISASLSEPPTKPNQLTNSLAHLCVGCFWLAHMIVWSDCGTCLENVSPLWKVMLMLLKVLHSAPPKVCKRSLHTLIFWLTWCTDGGHLFVKF